MLKVGRLRSVVLTSLSLCLLLCGLLWTTGIAPAQAAEDSVHPLDGLTAAEYEQTVALLRQAGHVDEQTLYPLITLQDPDKELVWQWQPGQRVPRSAFVVAMHHDQVFEGEVDLTAGRVKSWTLKTGVQPNILLEEWAAAQAITVGDPGWQAAAQRRGISDLSQVFCVPLSAGYFALPEEEGKRLLRVVCFDQRRTQTNAFARPIEGLLAVVDLGAQQVIRLVERDPLPLLEDPHDYDETSVGELQPPAKPVLISQPQGSNLEQHGHLFRWRDWSFHLRLDKRVGTVLSVASYRDQGVERPVLYQATLSEMFVPYMDPVYTWAFRTYFDSGEYGFGMLATPLQPGIDCPSHALFLDATLADDHGRPYTAERVICVFEQNPAHPVWRHSEFTNGTYEGRPDLRLVIRMIGTVGNYDYILDWVLGQTGTLQGWVGATGIDSVKEVAAVDMQSPTAEAETAYGTLLAPHLVGINHDHFFSFRLDLDVDGIPNTFIKDNLVPQRVRDSLRRSLWTLKPEIPKTEAEAKYRLDYAHPSLWRVVNPEHPNAVGNPSGYQLMPLDNQMSLLAEADLAQQRAGFTRYHLWVTPYHPQEKYAAGPYPNQSHPGAGLPQWTAQKRPLPNQDVVLWYTLGFHHIPRAEDWPVMPTAWHGFALVPFNFFDRNPAINLLDQPLS
ncbi:MAG: primary-amine oxidase [Thermostichus sp. HHBFW_bins_43]